MTLRFWIGLVVVGASLTGVGADLVGKVTFRGTPTPGKEVVFDPVCAGLAGTNRVELSDYVVGASNSLAGVVVYLQETPTGIVAKTDAVTLEKKGCLYTPYVAVAQVNEPVYIRNSDPVMNSIRTVAEGENPAASYLQYAKASDFKFSFANPEPFVRVKSDYQASLSAYIYVVSGPCFTLTDKDGQYKISGVPEGGYTLVAHHRLAGMSERAINVAGKTVTNNFVLAK